ncbi:MAG: class I SAM-dependent methyltransferase [Acidobacteria bacterium]|nr:class I SAM-dependent methyltransferase [Acidobacteriota bacterium]
MTNPTMTRYYARRATEYERIYLKPERQTDITALQSKIVKASTGLNLLEIACGTGYWTQFACRTAKSILATDFNEEVLSIARKKEYGACPVTFLKADAYVLDEATGFFSGALLGFWWSHVPRSILGNFLHTLHSKLCWGARIIVFDNQYVEGSSTPISRTDTGGNTYQVRSLSDGSTHEVLKNFPTQHEFVERIVPFSESYGFTELDYYWFAEYTLKEDTERGAAADADQRRLCKRRK